VNLRPLLIAAATIAATALVSCGADSNDAGYTNGNCASDGPIQRLIDQAKPGDTVQIPAGHYTESVVIDKDDLTIVGSPNPADTTFDGCKKLPVGMLVTGDRVSVRGFTFSHFAVTGLFFNGVAASGDTTPIDGFEAQGIVAYNNGLYGIYAFEATNGTIANTYTSGHPDSGIYVGQCSSCNVIVQDSIAEHNAVGFEGVNSSEVWIVNSVFRNNRIGITPSTQSTERNVPQQASVIAGNLVIDNNQPADTPEQAAGGWGLGIAIGGGNQNLIVNNRVTGHDNVGIAITSMTTFDPTGNTVTDNTVTGNTIDLGWWLRGGQTPTDGNCFRDNTFDTSTPADIETVLAGTCAGQLNIIDAPVYTITPGGAGSDWRIIPDPTIPTIGWDANAAPQFGVPAGTTADSYKVPAL
jgi:nitrous oxidase accessory protein NosD